VLFCEKSTQWIHHHHHHHHHIYFTVTRKAKPIELATIKTAKQQKEKCKNQKYNKNK